VTLIHNGAYAPSAYYLDHFQSGIYDFSVETSGKRVGTTILTGLTDPLADLTTAYTNFVAAGFAYTTAIAGMGASTKMIAASFAGLTINNLVRKIQYVNWELGRVGADLTLVKAGTGFTFAVGRYPSSLNRWTNTSGGI
jgi:hypothetical protein